jgi:two-component system response regulator AlgR
MRLLIVDDEPLARQRLQRLLTDRLAPWAEFLRSATVVEAANGEEALKQAAMQPPDVVFLDIRMPGLDGLTVARQWQQQASAPLVIFTTAYSEHALTAFDVQAIDYLLKPIDSGRLQIALEKAWRYQQSVKNYLEKTGEKNEARQQLSLRIRGQLTLLPVSQVFYFQSELKYINVRYPDGVALLDGSLKHLADKFAKDFLRVHRNALAARQYLKRLVKTPDELFFVEFVGISDTLEVSRRHLPEVRRFFRQQL